jgi:hypothetical protein
MKTNEEDLGLQALGMAITFLEDALILENLSGEPEGEDF